MGTSMMRHLSCPGLRRTGLAAAAVLLAALLAPPLAPAAEAEADSPWSMSSSEAELIVAIPRPAELSQQLAALAAASGLDAYAPELASGWDTLKRQMDITEGVDDERPMLLVVQGLAASLDAYARGDASVPPPTAFLLVPVQDYDAFVTPLGGQADQKPTAITLNGSDGFAGPRDGYAVLGEDAERVRGYAPAEGGPAMLGTFGALASASLAAGDAMVAVDLAKLGPGLVGAMQTMGEAARQEMAGGMQGVPPAFADATAGFIDGYFNTLGTIAQGGEAMLVSLDVRRDGVTLDAVMGLKDGSELAGFFPDPSEQPEGGASATDLLAALPGQPYLYATAVDAGGLAIGPLIDRLTAALGGEGEAAGMMTAYLQSFEMFRNAQAGATAFYVPQPAAMMTGGFFTSLTVYQVDDAKAFLDQQKQAIEQLAELRVPLPATADGRPAGELTFQAEYRPKALVLEGVEVDQYQVKTVLPPAMMQQFGPLSALMGNSGQTGYLAAKGDKVLVTTVTDPQLITRGLRAVDADAGLGRDDEIATLRDAQLPDRPWVQAYVSLGGMVQTVNPFLPMLLPQGQPVRVPDDLPPLALGGTSDGQALLLRTVVPADLVRFGVETYETLRPDQADPNRGGMRRAPR
jgi:hypothetical protein